MDWILRVLAGAIIGATLVSSYVTVVDSARARNKEKAQQRAARKRVDTYQLQNHTADSLFSHARKINT